MKRKHIRAVVVTGMGVKPHQARLSSLSQGLKE
jgi:hypothetical protein